MRRRGALLLLFFFAYSQFSNAYSKNENLKEIKKIEISVQIAKMMGADQALRFSGAVVAKKGFKWDEISSLPEYQESLGKIDATNAVQIKKIIAEWGWPTISDFGAYTAKNVWLLVQHMDDDKEFQSLCLQKMGKLLSKNEVNKIDYGYLYDRVQVNGGKPQKYGTQGECVGKGEWKPKPLENEAKLDQLRADMGMPSMKEYKKVIQENCL